MSAEKKEEAPLDPDEVDPEEELNRTYQLGQSAGMKYASSLLMELAKREFSAGADDLARRFRGISEDLAAEAKSLHPGVF